MKNNTLILFFVGVAALVYYFVTKNKRGSSGTIVTNTPKNKIFVGSNSLPIPRDSATPLQNSVLQFGIADTVKDALSWFKEKNPNDFVNVEPPPPLAHEYTNYVEQPTKLPTPTSVQVLGMNGQPNF